MTIACTLKEQDEMIVSSVSSVLLQGTATARNSLTTIAAVRTGRTTLRCWERGGVPEMSTKLIVKFHSAFPARIAHPAVAEFGAGAERLDHGLDQQVADENSVRSQCHREVVQEITQLNKDQDVKTNDHVSRIQGVLHSLAVRVRDDAGFVTEARSDPQPRDSDHGKSRFEAARRDQDDQKISRSGAVLQRMCQWSLSGRRKPSSIACWDTLQQRSSNDACRPEIPC